MKYGSRKFVTALLVVVSADVLVWLGSIEASVWGATIGSVAAAYIAGNIAEKMVRK
ncbi:hypothetical protein [Cupriavidus pampae]|uniref:Holin n=1 Tax=Cupriavidus pampae TaxID=659251 RepID=A0ABN7YWR5_9BURK|nr:hypothetical protein [Cupriavidus pampae]CAG9177902.1 hypothetical protein LMG32289_03942 [Cupriavidus pampae]